MNRNNNNNKSGKKKHRVVVLERVIGTTTLHNNALSTNEKSGDVATLAGATIVVYNPRKNRQRRFFRPKSDNNNKVKALSCVQFSPDGEWIAAGERGHEPCVHLFNLRSAKKYVSLKSEHKFSISCIRFSPNGKYIVSIGGFKQNQDLVVRTWQNERQKVVARARLESQVSTLVFHESGRFFVTCGARGRVSFWYLDAQGNVTKDEMVGFLGGCTARFARTDFVDVVCGRGACRADTYCITSDGTLCCFGQNRMMERWVHLETTSGFALSATENFIFACCSNGTVRVLKASSFEYVATLPRPAPVVTTTTTMTKQYPSAICAKCLGNRYLVTLYGDRSMYVWDIRDSSRIGRVRSFLHHSGCIWDLTTFRYKGQEAFATCSVDGSFRVWTTDSSKESYKIRNENWKSQFSRDLMRVVPLLSSNECLIERPTDMEFAPSAIVGSGLRCLACCQDSSLRFSVCDKSGQIFSIDLSDSKASVKVVSAHDAEILSVAYVGTTLATSSRDRLVHIFRHENDNSLKCVQTLENHSSTVNRVRWDVKGSRLMTCGADQSVVICEKRSETELKRVQLLNVARGSVYDMDIDAGNKFLVTASQDKMLNIWNVSGATKPSLVRRYKINSENDSEGCCAYRVRLDPSGLFVAVCCFDKWIRILDFYSGSVVARFMGHADLVTSLKWTSDCERVVTVSGDGCIFLWKIHPSLTASMKARLEELGSAEISGSSNSSSSIKKEVPTPEPSGLFGMMLSEANEAARVSAVPLGGVKKKKKDNDIVKKKKDVEEKKRRPSITDLRRVQDTIKKEKKKDGKNISRWSQRVPTGGYDLIGQSGVHRYHANKEQSNELTLSAELSSTTATSTQKDSKLVDSEEDEDVTTASKLSGDDDDDDDNDDDDDDDESDDGKMDRRSPVPPESDNDSRFNVTLKQNDEHLFIPPLPEPSDSTIEPSKSADPTIKTTTVLEEMHDHSSYNRENDDDVKILRKSLSSQHFSTVKQTSESSDSVDVQRERTEESVEAVQRMKTKLQEMGLVRKNNEKHTPKPSPPTPSRPERVLVSSPSSSSSFSTFQDSVRELRASVQKTLLQLRAMSRTSTNSEFKTATEMFETSIRDAHREIGTLRMSKMIPWNIASTSSSSSITTMSGGGSRSPAIDLDGPGVEAILDKYSDILMEKLEKKMSKKKKNIATAVGGGDGGEDDSNKL